MNRLRSIIVLLVSLVTAGQAEISAQSIMKAAGAEFAFTGIGISLQKYTLSRSAFHDITIAADLQDVLTGQSRLPGVRISYTMDYVLATASTDTFTLRWFAGPGFTAGYVRDMKSGFGIMAGICGNAGAEFSFRVPVCISISFTPCLATHISYGSGIPNLDLYRSGIILQSISPKLGIRYEF